MERATVWHRLVGVDDEVRDHLADLAGVDFSRREIVAELEFTPVATAPE